LSQTAAFSYAVDYKKNSVSPVRGLPPAARVMARDHVEKLYASLTTRPFFQVIDSTENLFAEPLWRFAARAEAVGRFYICSTLTSR
jgi:hypothetical protein